MERPILFSGPMVRAILEGRKTQTRRIVKKRNKILPGVIFELDYGYVYDGVCPYSKDDTLWVRETWWQCTNNNDRIYYAASETPDTTKDRLYRKRPSIFLKRTDSRINLKITSVKIEHLQEISQEDAINEGIINCNGRWNDYRTGQMKQICLSDPRDSFKTLWDSINEKRGFGWDKNPFVWVVKFKKL